MFGFAVRPSTDETFTIEPPPRGAERRRGRLHAEEGADLVHAHVALEVGERGLLERLHREDPRVVHQHGEAAEARGRALHGARPVGLGPDVEPHEGGGVAELLRDGLALGLEQVADHHARALGHEEPRHLLTRAARTAGHERDLAVEAPHFFPWNQNRNASSEMTPGPIRRNMKQTTARLMVYSAPGGLLVIR